VSCITDVVGVIAVVYVYYGGDGVVVVIITGVAITVVIHALLLSLYVV